MLERARKATRYKQYTAVQYARFADDLVILVDAHPRHDWLVSAVTKRLREEIGKLRVEINEEKSRIVDLRKGESFGFLGFDFRLVRSLKGAWRPQYTPKLKKRTAILTKLREIFPAEQEPTGRTADRTDQPDPAGLGELLCGRPLQSVLCVYRGLGRKENPAAHDASKETQGIRLETME